MMKQKAILAGGTGFIGTYIEKELMELGMRYISSLGSRSTFLGVTMRRS